MNAIAGKTMGQGPRQAMVLHGWFGPSVYDGFFDSFDLNISTKHPCKPKTLFTSDSRRLAAAFTSGKKSKSRSLIRSCN